MASTRGLVALDYAEASCDSAPLGSRAPLVQQRSLATFDGSVLVSGSSIL